MSIGNTSSVYQNNSTGIGDEAPAVKSITRAVQVLNCLDEGINTITDIAATCSLSKSTVHRLLRALEETFLVIHEPKDHRYYLGPLVTKLVTNPQIAHAGLITYSLNEMQYLVGELGETVNICVMPALKAVIVHEIPSPHELRVTDEAWKTGYRYAGAVVRVLLSQLSNHQLRLVMKHINLTQVTSTTITHSETFLSAVKLARKQGYDISSGEAITGSFGVAAPLHHYIFPAAIGVVGTAERLSPNVEHIVKLVKRSANRISGGLANNIR